MAFKIPEDTNIPTSKEQIEQWNLEKEKLVNLPGGEAIDKLIARKVFGRGSDETPAPYSFNPEYAWWAVEQSNLFDDLNVLLGKDADGNWAVVYDGQDYTTLIASAKYLSLALCRAILSVIFDREHPIIKPTVTFIEPMTGNPFSKG